MKVRRVDWYPGDWLPGTERLNAIEIAVYITVINKIYDEGGAIERDDRWLANRLRLRKPIVTRTVDALKEKGKLIESDSKLICNRCEDELERARNRLEAASKNAGKRWEASHKPLKNTDLPNAPASGLANARARDSINHQPSTIIDSEAKASAEPPDPVKAVFDKGIAILMDAHLTEGKARSVIGGWRKNFTDAAVMAAIVACENGAASEPVSFITGCLRNSRKGINGHGRSTAAGDRMRASFQAIIDADRAEDLLSGAGVNGCNCPGDQACDSAAIGAEPRQSTAGLDFGSADLRGDPKGSARRSH